MRKYDHEMVQKHLDTAHSSLEAAYDTHSEGCALRSIASSLYVIAVAQAVGVRALTPSTEETHD